VDKAPEQHDRRAGVTLLELMLVIALLALLLGGGVGLLSSLDLGRRQAAGLVRSVLRSAQNTAIASSAPARVRLDRAAGRLFGEALVTVGTWHFEGRSLTGAGPAGVAEPEDFDPRGFTGACLRPAARPRSFAEIPLERDPAFDFTHGFALECALYRESAAGGRVLVIGESESPTLGLELGQNGALRARMRTRLGDASSERPGGSVLLQSEPGLVPVGRWMVVRVRYDRARFELMLDGVVVASQEEASYVWRVDAPLVLSDRAYPFPGRIDALVIAVMVVGVPASLPARVRFASDAPELVQFAAGGGLDRSAHAGPPRIALEFEDGAREVVSVGLYGTVE
jgi:prepilin-type N-terminal cleavage/methylation domain-containing protein